MLKVFILLVIVVSQLSTQLFSLPETRSLLGLHSDVNLVKKDAESGQVIFLILIPRIP